MGIIQFYNWTTIATIESAANEYPQKGVEISSNNQNYEYKPSRADYKWKCSKWSYMKCFFYPFFHHEWENENVNFSTYSVISFN